MPTFTTRPEKYTGQAEALYLAFELSSRTWKLGMTVGFGQKARERNVAAGDLLRLKEEILAAKERFGLPKKAPVYSCYEAGRDGFWIDRALKAMGVENVVVDPSSIEVPRRKRRAKTDRLDVHKLLRLLLRYQLGERKVWSVVRVPSIEAEEDRHMHRELAELKREQTQHINRIRGLLATLGVRHRLRWKRDLAEQLKQLRLDCPRLSTVACFASPSACSVSSARSENWKAIERSCCGSALAARQRSHVR
jgi:transposase